jgi:uncharacterized protein YigA (DUF484 family)
MRHSVDTTAMDGAPEASGADPTATADQVVRFLRENPDFLLVQPELLHDLAAPLRWSGDTVVDFQRFMVDMLRGELSGMRDCASAVIETSRTNMSVQAQTHAAALSLVAAADADELVRMIGEDLPVLLGVDAAILAIEPHPAIDTAISTICRLDPGVVDALLGDDRDSRLIARLPTDGFPFVDAEPPIRSAAFTRLTLDRPEVHGLLALGAQEEGFFAPAQGTDLLRFLARIIETCLRRHLPTPS